jgi:anti-sigma factor RsiW
MVAGMTGQEGWLELIHAEIDGELDGAGRAELNRTLLADPAVRALRDEMQRFCRTLDAVPAEDVPAGLHRSIMESLPASPPECEDRDVRPGGGRFGRPTLRFAAAFAGALLAGTLAFQFAVRHDALDSRELAGTIAAPDASHVELQLDAVRGTIELAGTPAAPVVQAKLAVSRPVQVIAHLDGQELRLSDFAAPHNEPVTRSGAFTRPGASSGARVSIEVVDAASGRVLRATELRPAAPR